MVPSLLYKVPAPSLCGIGSKELCQQVANVGGATVLLNHSPHSSSPAPDIAPPRGRPPHCATAMALAVDIVTNISVEGEVGGSSQGMVNERDLWCLATRVAVVAAVTCHH